jgi:hypothetical protein
MAGEIVKTISQGRRNLLLNGDFNLVQRSSEFGSVQRTLSGGGLYMLDRWQAWSSSFGSTSGGVQRQSSQPAGFPGVGGQVQNCHRVFATVTDFTQNIGFLRRQKVESIRLKDGNRAITTVSCGFWYNGNNMQEVSLQIFQASGGGGPDDFSSITLLGEITVPVTADDTWQYVKLENVTIPNSNGLEIRLVPNNPAANVFTDTYISEVMLNEGSTVEPFRLMGLDSTEEVLLSKRYYQIVSMFYGSNSYQVGGNWFSQHKLATPMRALPVVTNNSTGGVAEAIQPTNGDLTLYQTAIPSSSSFYATFLDAEL